MRTEQGYISLPTYSLFGKNKKLNEGKFQIIIFNRAYLMCFGQTVYN